MKICRLYCNFKRYDGTTPLELSYTLEHARKNEKLSQATEKLFNNELTVQHKECAICDIVSYYRKKNSYS